MFNYVYRVRQCQPKRLLLSCLPLKCLGVPGSALVEVRALRCMASDLRQKRKLNHLPQYLLVLLPAKTIQHMQSTFYVLLLDNQTTIFSDMFAGRSDRILQCALPAFTYRQLQEALKLICNSHSF